MTAHLSAENLEDYRRRSLAPQELLAADDHLAACESCRELAANARTAESAVAALSFDLHAAGQFEGEHLSYEQMSAYVDLGLDAADRSIAESHLALCSMCTDETNDLRAFSETMQMERTLASQATASPGFWNQIRQFSLWPADWSAPRFAATAVGLLLLASVAAVLFYVWKSTSSPPLESAAQPTPASQAANENTTVPLPSASSNPSPIIVVSLDDGGQRVTLDEQGNLEGFDGLSPPIHRALKAALTDGRVETPATLGALLGKSGVLMGGPSEGVAFPLVGPVGTIIRSDRPTFRWRPLAGAQSYTVTLLDSNLKLSATSPPLTATSWTSVQPLKRGQTYVWQVTALKDDKEVTSPGPPAPEARFKILEGEKVADLRRVESSHSSSRLVRGISYAQAGLLEEAEREFRALLAANPQSDVARKLLRTVEVRRRAK